MDAEKKREWVLWLLPAAGTLFCLWYVKYAVCDVVYSDYIRLVNGYLPDVWDPGKFFVPDVLTRIPINYLCRIVNVELFDFSITFERVLGVVSLGLAGLVFASYCRLQRIGCLWFSLLMAVMFSLNKWEMLTNGSGWSHFFAFACFYYHELVLERVWTGREKKHDRLKLLILPWLIILGTAGPYCAVYAAVMMLSYGFCMAAGQKREKWDKRYLIYIACVFIPLLLYILSNSFAVEEHAGATGRSLGTILTENPTFPVRFLLKSLAGILVGGEELTSLAERGILSDRGIYGLGLLAASGYLLSLWLIFRHKLYKKSLLPLMLLAGGAMNHILIFLSRYIFEREDYAMSSRYALQFQVGILGMILTFAVFYKAKQETAKKYGWIMGLFCLAILLGNGYTTYHEIKKAPYREENFEKMAQTALLVPSMNEEELKAREKELSDLFEYRKGADKIQRAFQILEENKLNVFSRE